MKETPLIKSRDLDHKSNELVVMLKSILLFLSTAVINVKENVQSISRMKIERECVNNSGLFVPINDASGYGHTLLLLIVKGALLIIQDATTHSTTP